MQYAAWPKVPELAISHFNGPVERRGNSLIVIEKEELTKLQDYLDPPEATPKSRRLSGVHEVVGRIQGRPTARAKYEEAGRLTTKVASSDTRLNLSISGLPIWTPGSSPCSPAQARISWNTSRYRVIGFSSPATLPTRRPKGRRSIFLRKSATTIAFPDTHDISPCCFPRRPRPRESRPEEQGTFLAGEVVANLSPALQRYLSELGIQTADARHGHRALVWMHALAIGYSPAYLTENADGIRRDWPRIPLPADHKTLEASAALGEQVAALLDTEAKVPGVTCGKMSPLLRTVGLTKRSMAGNLIRTAANWPSPPVGDTGAKRESRCPPKASWPNEPTMKPRPRPSRRKRRPAACRPMTFGGSWARGPWTFT